MYGALQALMRGERREQLDAHAAELKKVQSHLKLRKDELIMLHDEQTR